MSAPTEADRWKILVVDDSVSVRTMTRLSLDGFTYRNRGLELLEAASAAEAQALLTAHQDVAVAIIDVVMETDHAGLDLVRWIRTDRQNLLIRLVIRTGQAGLHPASAILADYEINDYWEKTELTFSRLHTSLTTSLRGYEDLLSMHRRTLQLRQWADRFPDLLGMKDWNSLLRRVLAGITELFPDASLSAFVSRNDGRRWPLISGIGDYPATGDSDVLLHLDEDRAAVLLEAWDHRGVAESPRALALYFEVSSGEGHLFFLDLPPSWGNYERNVIRLVFQNLRATLENRTLIDDLERHRAELATLVRRQEDLTKYLHHRFQSSLQVVLSFIEIESRDRSGISGRSPLAGAERRLHVLALLHSQLYRCQRLSGLDFQAFLQSFVDQERLHRSRPSEPGIEYWGVPVEVEVTQAVPLALAVVEMVDLVRAPRWRTEARGVVQVVLSDGPRSVTVGLQGATLTSLDALPLEWELLATLASQIGGAIAVEGGALRLSF